MRRRWSEAIFACLTLLAIAALLSLGAWQMRRLSWKEALIEKRERHYAAEAAALPHAETWGETDWRDFYHRRFALSAKRILDGRALRLFAPREKEKTLYGFIRAYQTSDGGAILVETGSDSSASPKNLREAPALFLPPEEANLFTPDADRETGLWFRIAPDEMAAELGLERAPPGLFRLGGRLPPLRNNHFSYALTWFALAITAALLYLIRLAHLPPDPPPT